MFLPTYFWETKCNLGVQVWKMRMVVGLKIIIIIIINMVKKENNTQINKNSFKNFDKKLGIKKKEILRLYLKELWIGD